MKSKITKPVKILGACVIGIILCLGIYYFVDYILNGSFVDWFEEHYMITQEQYIPEIGSNGIVRQPVYSEIKKLLLLVFISVVILGIGITFAVSHFHAKSQTRKAITKIGEKMHDFMQSEKEAVEVFPKEYAEISTQMVEIKSTMQRHEQILKEEAARKNDLIAYLAHDLKTPLTLVIGYLSLLDEAVDMPTPQRAKYVSITLDKAKRLEKLINEFFEITRYNLQGIVLEKETIDLYYMLVQMTDEFYPLLQAHQNTTELDVDEEMTIYGDNDKAQELGMKNTHFTNSTGLHDPEHYSTVEDISILLQYALKNEYFRDVFTSSRYSTLPSEQHPEGFTFHSTMFKYMDSTEVTGGEILGGKTGYTEEAGLCLASLAQVNGKEYILVTAKANGTHQTEQFHILDAINVYSQIGEAGQNTYE